MPTDTERREVARRLRGAKYGWHSWERALYDALGVDLETAGLDMLDRLADIIDPDHVGDSNKMFDRDALLALADEMDHTDSEVGWTDDAMPQFARRIREALGVSDDA